MAILNQLAQSLGMTLAMAGVVLVVFLVGSVFYIRTKVKGRVYCYLLAANKQLSGHLLKPQGYTVTLGDGDDAPKFLLHPSKQFWDFWPHSFPRAVQEPVPAYFYSEGNAEPLDPYDRTALISPESLRKISDEAMLKQTWKDVRETLGIKTKFAVDNRIALLLIGIAVIASCIAAYMGYQNMGHIAEIISQLP